MSFIENPTTSTEFTIENPQHAVGYWQTSVSKKIRGDDRQLLEARDLKVVKGILTRADGAVEVSCGKTLVIATVNGPIACEKSRELPDRATIEVGVKFRNSSQTTVNSNSPESVLAVGLRNAFADIVASTLYPRTKIIFTVQVITDDGSLYATAFNACMAAALHAGLSCFRTVTAATLCHRINDEGVYELLVDPTAQEEAKAVASLTVAYAAAPHIALIGQPSEEDSAMEDNLTKNEDKLVLSSTKGAWNINALMNAMRHGETTCMHFADILRGE